MPLTLVEVILTVRKADKDNGTVILDESEYLKWIATNNYDRMTTDSTTTSIQWQKSFLNFLKA